MDHGQINLILGLRKVESGASVQIKMMESFGCVLRMLSNILKMRACAKLMIKIHFRLLNFKEVLLFLTSKLMKTVFTLLVLVK